jgi:RimJ/RimL family protein N-acetyltransferase
MTLLPAFETEAEYDRPKPRPAMLPTFDPLPTILNGHHVRLEPLGAHHAADLFVAGDDPDIWRYKPIPRPVDLGDTEAWIASAIERAANGTEIPFAIIHRASGRAIGSTRYLDIRHGDRALEIGWTWIGREHQRSAVNTECKYLLLTHAFERHGAIRVQFKADSRNVRSLAAIERIGGIREGLLRNQRILHDGYIRDAVIFSIIDNEWPTVKARLEDRRSWVVDRGS